MKTSNLRVKLSEGISDFWSRCHGPVGYNIAQNHSSSIDSRNQYKVIIGPNSYEKLTKVNQVKLESVRTLLQITHLGSHNCMYT